MRIAFQRRPHSLWEKLICWWTGGPYYHCAMWFSDGILFESLSGTGVRMAVVNELDPKIWTTIIIPTTLEQESQIQSWAAGELGCKYDWLGIIMAQVFHIPRASRNKWFCSEFTVEALHQIGILKGRKPCTVSPNKLFKLLQKV
jgi:uncharacterized protein YycO